MADTASVPRSSTRGVGTGNALYADVGAHLDGEELEGLVPGLLYRLDGIGLFYWGQVNCLFGDAEAGKTWVAYASAATVLLAGKRVLLLDMDHNGLAATVARLLDLGVPERLLRDLDRFRYVEPEDRTHLLEVVQHVGRDRWPDLAIVDSTGELMPLLGLSSNSPDDYTTAHGLVLKPLAMTGAAVVAIDHLPKSPENKANGPTGTAAKRRAIGGSAIRVVVDTAFTPGKGGKAVLTLNKDRHGGLRRYCSNDAREPLVGVFVLTDTGTGLNYEIRQPQEGDAATAAGVPVADLAALDALVPPPASVRDVKDRLRWGSTRATAALDAWRARSRVPTPLGGERGNTPTAPRSSVPELFPGNGEHELAEAVG